MGMPLKRSEPKNIINVYDNDKYTNIGLDRVQELMAQTDKKTKYLPRTITFEDIDTGVFDFVNEGKLKLVLNGKEVPVFYMENERWGEFSKTWKFMDEDKNVKTPYITVRRIGKAKGTRLGNKATIPQPMFFTYMDVPILDEGQLIYLRYKMPQPINVDLKYEITLFTHYRTHVNEFDNLILKTFSSIQSYIFVNGSPIPLIMEDFSEPKSVENSDGDKIYICKYPIKAQGFTMDENDFKITKTSRKPFVGTRLY